MYKYIIIFLCCYNSTFGSDTTIVFRQIKYSQLFEVAKKEQKKVMLFFHFDGCSACIKMEKEVFTNRDVYEYYNSSFICFSIDILKGDGVNINKIYNVQTCPTFTYLDPIGNEVHKIVGAFSSDEFIKQGEIAYDTLNSLAGYLKRYKNGDRKSNFLRKYCYVLENANQLDSFTINQYISTLSIEDMKQFENIKFIYEFAYHNHEQTIAFNSVAFNFMLRNRSLFNSYFDSSQVAARLVFLTLDALYNAIDNKSEKVFKSAIETLKAFDGKIYIYEEIDNRITAATDSKHLVLHAMLAYYEKNSDKNNYEKILDKLIHSIWNESNELNSLAWNYYEKYNDEKQLTKAVNWAARSVELKNAYANNDTWAAILYKLGKKK